VTGSVQLRPMRWMDIAGGVLDLEQQLFTSDSWSEELFWSELAERNTRHYLVAEDDTGIVGYAGLCVYGDEAYVQTMAVATDHQGSGIGTRLLVALMLEARRRSVGTVALEVRADNPTAQRLYARFGFEAVGLRRGYYQPSNVDAVVMVVQGVASPAYGDLLASQRPLAAP
jgi:ribosomal-protein-alanine N-acetyltransferase